MAHEHLLKVEEAASRLGLTSSAIRKWIFYRNIEFVRIGRAVRIPESVIDGIIANGTVKPISL